MKEILDLKSDEEIGDAEIFKFVQEIEKLSVGFAQKNNDIKTITLIAQIFTKVERLYERHFFVEEITT